MDSIPYAESADDKLRLMCSFGGHIIPRPHDKSLCYVGGDTRMVVVDRNTTLAQLHARLSKTLPLLPPHQSFTLKYQLPNEDLDSLISVTTDDDLENMIDEFDRISANRLRVFLFSNRVSAGGSSIESVREGSLKSEDWFYSTLDGSGFADVNSDLLGLENDAINSVGSVKSLGSSRELEIVGKSSCDQAARLNRDDSLVIETSSSFGSTSSSPSLANFPPIKVKVEEQFAQMSVSAVSSPPPIPTTLIPAQGIPVNHDDDGSERGVPVGYDSRQPQTRSQQLQLQVPQQQKQSGIFDIASPDSASSDGSILYQDTVARGPSGYSRVASSPVDSNNPRVQVQPKVSEPGYILNSQLEQQQLLQQQQFIHPGTNYIQRPQNAVPIPQYYHPYPPQNLQSQHDQPQYPLYFIPPTARQSQQAYSMPVLQGTYSEPSKPISSSQNQNPLLPTVVIANPLSYKTQPQNVPPVNPELASNIYRTAIPTTQPMVQVAPGQHQQQYISYTQAHHPPQSMPLPQNPASATTPNYAYEYSNPARAQIYYTQPLAAVPTCPPQDHTMITSSPMVMISDASSTQIPNDNMKHHDGTLGQ